MKTIILVFVLATTSPAAMAQFLSPVPPSTITLPKTMKLYNNQNGQVIGTATQNGRTLYLRDLNSELVGSVTMERDGKRTFRDPSGNVVDGLSIAGGPIKPPDEP